MNDINQRVKELIDGVPLEFNSPAVSDAIDRLTLVCNLLNQRVDALEKALQTRQKAAGSVLNAQPCPDTPQLVKAAGKAESHKNTE